MKKKTVILGVTSSIATYKSVQLTSDLLKKGYDVEVIMSKNATQFVAPLTFSTLTKHKTYTDTFDRMVDYNVEHISLAEKADLFVIVPATANVIAKVAHGIADDMLTTTFLACKCKKMIAPAMNTNMYQNPVTQENIEKCKRLGYEMIEPATGLLACGAVGQGKLEDISIILQRIEDALIEEKPLLGKKVLVSAGPTQEALDPVRFISNHSSGKMGYAIAKAAQQMGAEVTLVSGPVHLPAPEHVKRISIQSAMEMFEAFKEHYNEADFIIKAAAVGDYRPLVQAEDKIKKQGDTLQVTFVKNPDILAYLGGHKQKHQVLCGFAMETKDLVANAQEKLKKKNCDLLIANNLKEEGAGFQTDTNAVTILYPDALEKLELMSKQDLAKEILKRMLTISQKKGDSTTC